MKSIFYKQSLVVWLLITAFTGFGFYYKTIHLSDNSNIEELLNFTKNDIVNAPQADYEIDAYNGQTITVCSGNFFDSGGSGSSYSNNENYSMTFCSSNGNPIELSFNSFDVEANGSCSYDGLTIYNGSNASATSFGTFCGTNSPGTITSSNNNCLHVVFYSDGSVVEPGWEATINCQSGGGGGSGAEICDNGIDDDGDNLVDEFDPDCPCANTEFFFGDCTPTCEYVPQPGSVGFDLISEWTSAVGITNISQVIIGDMDGAADGASEVIAMKSMNYHASAINSIYLLDGNDGSLKYHPNTLRIHSRNKGLAIGDADKDGKAEFYYMTADDETTGNSRKIACYEYNPNGINPAGSGTGTFILQWTSNTQVTCGLSGGELFAVEDFTVGLADFNYDGTPEVYVGNEIYNAITGQRITTGGTNSIGSWNQGEFATAYHVMAVTVAMDVLPDAACVDCSGLELVAGNQVYSVNISGSSMTVRKQAPNSLPDGNTSIADYDLDGDLDAVITTNDASKSYLYIWDLQTNTQIGGTHTVQTTSSLFYHPINLPVIADFDGDNRPEIGVCGNFKFQVVEDHTVNITGTGGVLWSLTTSDNSGQTGASVFDFNGDGISEVVYRDESNLRIMAGPTGANLATFPCASGTGGEYSVVADIDNDGETEIVCNCADVPGSSNDIANTRAFKSDQYPWISTRKIWNQYAYFNVNINDDLTIPTQQQLQHLVGSPAVGVSGPLNTFLKQVSPLDKSGNRIFPAADLTTTTSVDGSQCVSNSTIDLAITVANNGIEDAPTNMPISIYSSDPENSNATLMAIAYTSNSIAQNSSLIVNYTLNVSSLSFPTTIYIVVNDDGTESRPYDLGTDFPITSIAECNFDNNKEDILLGTYCIDPCTIGPDTDGDGVRDNCDDDDDNDGILDVVECPTPASSGLTGPLMTFITDITTADADDRNLPHTLDSITYAGITYTDFIVPDGYTSSFSLSNPGGVKRKTDANTSVFTYASNPNWDQDILSAFQSRNLNDYQQLDQNNFADGDYYILSYSTPITSTVGVFMAVIERYGNNPQVVEALDINGNVIGTTINIATSAYVDLGVNISQSSSLHQNAFMALYPVDNLAPVGTEIYGLKISFGPTATSDGPDAKAFFFGDFAQALCDYDGDGIPNNLDLDSDGDGCPDAVEGGGNFTPSSLTNDRLTGGVGIDGIPNIVGSGQAVGSSQNEFSDACIENCNDGLDNDGDGLIDCADSDCIPVISNVTATALSCPSGVNNGQIVITATGSGTLSYSITNVSSYQPSNTFSNLGPGQYTIRVKNDAGCVATYTASVVRIDSPNCVEICNDGIDNDGDGLVDCDDPDCANVGTGNTISNQ